MDNYFITKKINDVFELIIEFILSYVIVSPIIGTIFIFLDLYWGIAAILINTVLSVLISNLLYKKHIFNFESLSEIVAFVVLMIFCVYLYGQYSPVLALEQDPAAYMFKALNLVNYGHVYKPMPAYQELIDNGILSQLLDYAEIQNGTQFLNGNLNVDFYSGACFLYATIGFFYKKWIFYGQTLVMMLNVTLFFFIIKKIFLKDNFLIKTSVLYIIAFFVSPVIVWFGRGSYTEPIAMVFILMIFYFLLFEKPEINLLILILLAAHSSRIDYILVWFVAIFVITYFDWKKGLIFSVLAEIIFYLFKKSYWIYSARIGLKDMKLFSYTPIIIIFMFIFSYFVLKYHKETIIKIFYSKYILKLYFILCFCLVALMFWNNVISGENIHTFISGHGQEIPSRVEDTFDFLFLVFPNIILIGGMLFLHEFLINKKLPFHSSVFFIGIITGYFYFFINSSNTPALYWLLRRYYNIILPFITISFIFFVFQNVTKKFNVIFGIILVMISFNLYLDSKQTIDYDGLDKSVQQIVDKWENEGIKIIFYEEKLRKKISPILTYSNFEMIPFTSEQFISIYNYYKNNSNTDEVLILNENNANNNEEYSINFTTLPMLFNAVPKNTQIIENKFYAMKLNNIRKDILYPSPFINVDFGFNRTDSWTKDKFTLYMNNYEINNNFILVEIENYMPDELIALVDLKLNIDSKIINLDHYESNKFYFDISSYKGKFISNIEFTMNTFNPKEKELSTDNRDIGIPLKSIYLK